MTQPAVSLAIKELEQYYGVRLFDRIGRRLQITDAGKQFLQYAIHITDLFEDMETMLRDWEQRVSCVWEPASPSVLNSP